jgi:DtxR family Mn-dependent transcriptional regulator
MPPIDDPELQELRTEAVEDFLKAVYKLQQIHDQVPTTALAQELNITPPSATDMAKKLADTERLKEPLLTHERYRGVKLTSLGERIALEVLRHHRLIELYLVEALGYSWDEVHDEAERLEHVISERFEARIAEALGNPEFDPHGDPIPTLDGKIPHRRDMVSLSQWELNRVGIVARLIDQDPAKLKYLHDRGLLPGAEILITEREPFDGVIHVEVNDKMFILSQSITSAVLIIGKPSS